MDLLKDQLIEQYKKPISIYDLHWFVAHINDTPNTVRSYHVFIDSFLHEFNHPGKSFEVANLIGDPRLYTYLRQQVDEQHNRSNLEQILLDTLILYALGDTDPDKGLFLTREEITSRIKELVKFDPRHMPALINKRLDILSKKPRRIHHHRDRDAYCLDYQERLHIQNQNLNDAALHDYFVTDTDAIIARIVTPKLQQNVDFVSLVKDTLNLLYYKQGVEFSEFVLHGSSAEVLQKNLPDIIAEAVDNRKITANLTQVKQVLLAIIRAIVYEGTIVQKTEVGCQ